MVSVCLITYNHECFIARALDSILEQETDFPVKIFIGEDLSTDGTRSICEEYQNKYPDSISLLPQQNNMGMMKNFIRTYNACSGNYIAFIEGDDFWTDKGKLQKQVNFLNENSDYSLCFHNVKMLITRNNSNIERPFHTNLLKDSFVTEDLLQQWFIPSCSIVTRVYEDFVLPEWYQFCKSGDIPFLLLISLKGKFKYIPETMGVYRVHDNGISATHNDYNKIISMIFIYENFNIYTNFRFKEKVREACIYEIDYHYPVKQIVNLKSTPVSDSLLVRIIRRGELLFRKGMFRLLPFLLHVYEGLNP